MNYIVGGTPRSGKTALKDFVLQKYKIPGFCTDFLRDALDNNVSAFGIKKGMNDREKSEILWPYLEGILQERSKHYRDDLLIEGTNFLPKYLREFKNDPNIGMVFLGFAEINPDKKFDDIRTFPSHEGEWTEELNDFELRDIISEFIEISKYFKSECEIYGIKYFDTSKDFSSVIEQAASYLIGR